MRSIFRVDIYALGASLFCLLAGRPPFIGNNPIDVITQAFAQPVPSLVTMGVAVPAEVEQIVQRCMAKDPQDRFTHAVELAAALQARYIMATQLSVRLNLYHHHQQTRRR